MMEERSFGHRSRVLVFGSLAMLLAGCLTPPPELRDPVVHVSPDIATVRPVAIAVLPVKASVSMPREWIDRFRRECYERLIEHKFTPVALTYVDDVLRDAQLAEPGPFESLDAVLPRFSEDAVLATTVRTWETDRLAGEGLMTIGADAVLFDPKTGTRLWMALIDREISVRGVQFSGANAEDATAWALARFTKDLFESLPMKIPPQGVRPPQAAPRPGAGGDETVPAASS